MPLLYDTCPFYFITGICSHCSQGQGEGNEKFPRGSTTGPSVSIILSIAFTFAEKRQWGASHKHYNVMHTHTVNTKSQDLGQDE